MGSGGKGGLNLHYHPCKDGTRKALRRIFSSDWPLLGLCSRGWTTQAISIKGAPSTSTTASTTAPAPVACASPSTLGSLSRGSMFHA